MRNHSQKSYSIQNQLNTFSGVYAPGPGFIATSDGTTYLVLNENPGAFGLYWLVSHDSYAPGAGVTYIFASLGRLPKL